MQPGVLLGQQLFIRAVGVSDHQVAFAFIGLLPDEYDARAVRRKADVAIDIVNDALRAAAQHRRAVQTGHVFLSWFVPDEIDRITVGRKAHAPVAVLRWRNDLRVALGGNVAQPQALLAVLALHIQDVVSVG